EPREQRLAPAEQYRRDRDMQLVDQAACEQLPHRRGAAADLDVEPAGGRLRLFERFLHAGDEMEDGAPLHRQRRAPMIGHDEGGRFEWRAVAPPALPGRIAPGAARRREHVPPEDMRAETVAGADRIVVVETLAAALAADHRLEDPGREQPMVQLLAALAE